jgi:trimethylguanosine synthase
MGKRKAGGLTGVSRFLLQSSKTEPESQPKVAPEQLVQDSQYSSADALPGSEEDRPSKQQEIKDLSTAQDPQTQGSQYSTADALPRPEERPSKRQKTKGSSILRDAQTQSMEEGGWIEKYSASGLVPYYTDASQVPDYLRKCTYKSSPELA